MMANNHNNSSSLRSLTKSKYEQLSEAAFAGHLNRLKRLAKELDDGRGIVETIATARDSDGRGLLHLAAVKGRNNICKYLLEELKIYVDDRDREDCTALVHASLEGHLSTVNCLIENGADLAARDKFNATPLHSATLDGRIEMMNLLLSKGADMDAQSDLGTPLQVASYIGNTAAIKTLLDHGANSNPVNDFPLPLYLSIEQPLDITKLLIQAGADPNAASAGVRPLHGGVRKGKIEFIKCLLEAGADPNITNDMGTAPIELAARAGNHQLVELLFPVTSPLPACPDWSISGIIKHVQSAEYRQQVDVRYKGKQLKAKSNGGDASKRKDNVEATADFSEQFSPIHEAPEEMHEVPEHPVDQAVPAVVVAHDPCDVVIHPVEDPEDPPSTHYTAYTSAPVTSDVVVNLEPYQRVSGAALLGHHLSQRIAGHDSEKPKGRLSLHAVGEWWKLIKNNPLFQHIRENIERTPFIPIIDCKYPHADRQLHRALGERWWPTTHTFHFPVGEVGITPLDFMVITGMGLGGGRRPLIQDEHPITDASIQLYLPHLGANWREGQMISTSAVRSYYNRMVSYTGYQEGVEGGLDLRPGSEESKEYTLAFLLLLLGVGIFSGQGNCISRHWIMPLVDLHLMHELDWGQAIYTTFIDRLDAFAATTSLNTSLGGYYPLLEIWYYEYVCTLYQRLPDSSAFPRITAWYSHVGESILRSNTSLVDARYQIETRFLETIRWRPWVNLPALARRSLQAVLLLSRSRSIMIGVDGTERVYLGDRHWRQLTGTFAIPHDPPRPLRSGVPAIREAPQDGESFVVVVHRSCYESWWARVSRGSLVPGGIYRDDVRDFIGREAMKKHEIQPSPRREMPPVLLPVYTVFTTEGVREDRLVGAWADQTPMQELDYRFSDYSLDEVRKRYDLSLRRLQGVRGGAYDATGQMHCYFSTRVAELEAERDAIRTEKNQLASRLAKSVAESGSEAVGGQKSPSSLPVRSRKGGGDKSDTTRRSGDDHDGTSSTRNVRARVDEDDAV